MLYLNSNCCSIDTNNIWTKGAAKDNVGEHDKSEHVTINEKEHRAQKRISQHYNFEQLPTRQAVIRTPK